MANTEHLWQELTAAAVLGTQRKPFQEPPPGGALGSAIRAVSEADSASDDTSAALLKAIALAAVHRRAGIIPACGEAARPTLCPPDKWPRCSAQAGALLDLILANNQYLSLLPEWIELAYHNQQRVREEYLPELLQHQRSFQGIRKPMLSVLGERGRWLARQNPDWQEIDAFRDETIWQEGRRKERAAFLSDLRERDPDRARELLQSTWNQETPAERVLFLRVLEAGISMADEPFLENLLDDRRKDVRQAAANLLVRLPESRLVRRMTERALKLLNWKNGFLRSGLEVNLPQELDTALERDGVEAQPPARSKLGEKAWWLAQILSAVPPRIWSQRWNKKPVQLIEALRKHEWETALHLGWLNAATLYKDAEWLEALLLYELRKEDQGNPPDVFARLPDTTKEKLMLSILREQPSLSYEKYPSIYLSHCRHPWSSELTRAVTRCIARHVEAADTQPWQWDRLLRDTAPLFHPSVLPEAIQQLENAFPSSEHRDSAVLQLIDILHFRLEMLQAFHPR